MQTVSATDVAIAEIRNWLESQLVKARRAKRRVDQRVARIKAHLEDFAYDKGLLALDPFKVERGFRGVSATLACQDGTEIVIEVK